MACWRTAASWIAVLMLGAGAGDAAPGEVATGPGLRILGENGRPTPARVVFRGDAAAEVPGTRVLWAPTGVRYFYTDGLVRFAPGHSRLELRVYKGFEYVPADVTIEPGAATATDLRLERAFDANARGYYSGDGHVHPMYLGSKVEWTNPEILGAMKGEGLNLVNALSGNALASRVYWRKRVTGRDEPESDGVFVLRVSEEYRSLIYGHMSVFGINYPGRIVFTAFPGTKWPYDFPLNIAAARHYQRVGAFASFAHLNRAKDRALEAPADIALGALSAVEIQGYAVPTGTALGIWTRLLNTGYDVVLTAGTDTVLGADRTPIIGGARVYVDLGEQPFGYDPWTRNLRAGHGFTTDGPLVFLRAAGRRPGERIRLAAGEIRELEVEVEVLSVFPWESLHVRHNGRRALAFESAPSSPHRQVFRDTLEVAGAGWLNAVVLGPEPEHAFAPRKLGPTRAVTNAVWIEREGERRRDAASARYFVNWIRDDLALLEERNNYGSPENRQKVHRTLNEAIRAFEQRASEE